MNNGCLNLAESDEWAQTTVKSPFGTNILSLDFDHNLPQSMTCNCARFKQNSFGGSAEIVSFKIILNISKVEGLHQKQYIATT